MEVFVDQLKHDIENAPESSSASSIPSSYLELILKDFAWKLHGESSNPFQWEAAVILRQKLKEIIALLVSGLLDPDDQHRNDRESTSDIGEEEHLECSFVDEPPDIHSWIDNIEPSPLGFQNVDTSHATIDDEPLPLLLDYKTFINQSDAYQWLLCKIRQQSQLELKSPILMCHIGMNIRNQLPAQEPLRKMSCRRSSLVTGTFDLDWNPLLYSQDQGITLIDPDILEKTLCLTGTWTEAQATTVVKYLHQTWPITGEHTINLMRKLIALPAGKEGINRPPRFSGLQIKAYTRLSSLCSISVTGSPCLVSEIAEQIAWLASTLRQPGGILSALWNPRKSDGHLEGVPEAAMLQRLFAPKQQNDHGSEVWYLLSMTMLKQNL